MSADAAPLVLLVRALDGGGMQRNVLRLAGAFKARGHTVDVLTVDDAGPMRAEIEDVARLLTLKRCGHWRGRRLAARAMRRGEAIDWRLLLGPGPGILAHLEGLVDYLTASRPQALLAFGTQCSLAALWAERLTRSGTRIVASERNVLSAVAMASRRRFRRRYPALVARTYPEAAAVVTVSSAIADDLAQGCGLAHELMTVIPNPVAPAERLAAAAPLDHPWLDAQGPPVLLGVGRLHRQKDFATLLRAVALLARTRPVRLVLLGEGEERPALERLAQELGISDCVAFIGFVTNPFAWMASAQLLVLTSKLEGFGNVLAEALAAGLPVVASDIPSGPREILDGGRFGRLVPPGDPVAFATAIARTLDAPPDPNFLRARARDFALDHVAECYLALLTGQQHSH